MILYELLKSIIWIHSSDITFHVMKLLSVSIDAIKLSICILDSLVCENFKRTDNRRVFGLASIK